MLKLESRKTRFVEPAVLEAIIVLFAMADPGGRRACTHSSFKSRVYDQNIVS